MEWISELYYKKPPPEEKGLKPLVAENERERSKALDQKKQLHIIKNSN